MKALFLLILLISSLFALPDEFDREKYNTGEKVFDNKCSECHEKSMDIQLLMKNFIEEDNKLLNLKAPTGNEISFRLKSQIGSREDIEFQLHEATDFVKDYLYNPDRSKTICLEGVIRHFKTMPSMKGKVTVEEIEDVTFFLYFLEGFNDVNEYYHKEDDF
ncbi:hypothetical protein [Halarcobacter bivalviorum]|uniref:Cytochrome c domain-containing protein n=1 Tax=Halarcobacter bivalviorum TaxID=663364 RepID=A0AAX2AAD3_9BACT|nr:hypothetical protein [Halarcobacter bivalviorum]AXH11144.1 hypothetical protein ABIV_0104 [Halarcobacter bivalviorum]RXK09671.1 hypothetical protein CRV05_08020 [Halarcobacter bivalviorum]